MKLFNKTRSIQTISSIVLACSAFLSTSAHSYCTDSPVDGAAYKIINKGSDLLLNVENASTSNGANINSLSNNGDASQRFYLRYQTSSHYWKMEAAHTGKLVNVSGGSTSNGGNVVQSNADGSTSQEWELKQQTDGTYRIVNRNSSYSLTVAGSAAGSNTYQNEDFSLSSQRWWLEPITFSCGSDSNSSSTDITLSGNESEGSVSLNWNSVADLNAVQVYYDTDSNPSGRTRLSILDTHATSYNASGLQNGTTYWFWIKYRTTDGVWHNSNAFSATPASANSIVLKGQAGNEAVNLTWNGLPNLSSLQVYYDTDSNPSGRSRLAALSTSATHYNASNLQSGTTYWFWIKYRTADAVWHNSNAFSATPSTASNTFNAIGFANGATGGAGGNTVTVSSCSDLKSYLQSSSTLTIQIPDNTTIDCRTSGTAVNVCKIACPSYQDAGKYTHRIPTSDLSCSDLGAESTTTKYRYDQKINVASNKTLIGLGDGAAIEGATLSIYDKSNVIIRNLAIGNINPDLVEGGDAVSIEYSDKVVVDHVKFSMISDGHVDIRNNSSVTLSYNHFDGYNPYVCANQHWYTNLVDNSNTTFHHNFWDYTAGRNPKLTGSATKAHLFNNYWLEVTYFSISANNGAKALVEGNYFDDAARPHWNNGNGIIDGNTSTNVYTGQAASGSYAVQDSGGNVSVSYVYSLEDANNMPNLVNEAGPQ